MESRVVTSARPDRLPKKYSLTDTPQETLNFKISPEFKREFKGYAVSQGMTMLDLLKEGFELSKRKRSAK